MRCEVHVRFQSPKDLLELVEEQRPDMVATYRCLHSVAWRWDFTLGAHIDVLTQATTTPVLLFPHPDRTGKTERLGGAEAPGMTDRVMAVTDHLTGDERLVNAALAFAEPEGTLFLSHVEDDAVFERYLDVIGKIPEIETESARETLGWQEASTDWRAVMAREDIDVVDIATPGHMHCEMALEAAKNGKHIICEKPLGRTAEESFDIWKGVAAHNVKAMTAFNYRFYPATVLAKEMIDAGELGEIYHFRGRYHQEWIMDPDFPKVWRLDKEIAGIDLSTLNSLLTHGYEHQMSDLVRDLTRLVVATASGEIIRGVASTVGTVDTDVSEFSEGESMVDLMVLDDLKTVIPAVEKVIIDRVLRRTMGNQSKAARDLNLSRGALIAKMKDYSIPDYRYLRRQR